MQWMLNNWKADNKEAETAAASQNEVLSPYLSQCARNDRRLYCTHNMSPRKHTFHPPLFFLPHSPALPPIQAPPPLYSYFYGSVRFCFTKFLLLYLHPLFAILSFIIINFFSPPLPLIFVYRSSQQFPLSLRPSVVRFIMPLLPPSLPRRPAWCLIPSCFASVDEAHTCRLQFSDTELIWSRSISLEYNILVCYSVYAAQSVRLLWRSVLL